MKVHEQLIQTISRDAKFILTSNCPIFLPKEYSDIINLRLDSNIIFYEETTQTQYKLMDIFAVRGGPPITLQLGKWNLNNGVTLERSANRWENRIDLEGATILNGLSQNGRFSDFIKDDEGNIVGSRGYFQEKLFYITDRLNLTMITKEIPFSGKLLANGTWTGRQPMAF